MSDALVVTINGKERRFPNLPTPTTVTAVVAALEMRADRIAVEHNGELASRLSWPAAAVRSGDRLEIVHFVGGGSA